MTARTDKLLNLALVLTSLFGYLEWGTDQHMFLLQGEFEILTKLWTDPASAAHPFTLLPLLGQVLLLVTLFQRSPNRWLTFAGIAGIGLLMGMILFIGLLGPSWKLLVSALPFMAIAVWVVVRRWRR
ncbi:MAG: hypothetical protein KDC54_02160 [Lewinella sp.]|nr:hypothetical protein [Lewinella sp.]